MILRGVRFLYFKTMCLLFDIKGSMTLTGKTIGVHIINHGLLGNKVERILYFYLTPYPNNVSIMFWKQLISIKS